MVHAFSGRCADAGYGVKLFEQSPEKLLCTAGQTIAGHVERCEEESVLALFRSILRRLPREEDEELTLPGHSVEPIRWRSWWRFW